MRSGVNRRNTPLSRRCRPAEQAPPAVGLEQSSRQERRRSRSCREKKRQQRAIPFACDDHARYTTRRVVRSTSQEITYLLHAHILYHRRNQRRSFPVRTGAVDQVLFSSSQKRGTSNGIDLSKVCGIRHERCRHQLVDSCSATTHIDLHRSAHDARSTERCRTRLDRARQWLDRGTRRPRAPPLYRILYLSHHQALPADQRGVAHGKHQRGARRGRSRDRRRRR